VTFEKGINIRGSIGDDVKAVHAGIVQWSDWFEGRGKMVIIDHGERHYTLYAHLSEFFVSKGAYVRKHQVIGRLGDTGSLQGGMLHFEIRNRATPLDPARWLRPRPRRNRSSR
jgi:murein DD-endopeptidase MepM/ murein hydrolase activator NlpD